MISYKKNKFNSMIIAIFISVTTKVRLGISKV